MNKKTPLRVVLFLFIPLITIDIMAQGVGEDCNDIINCDGCDAGLICNDLCKCESILPVELADFRAKQTDNKIQISWRTLSETNNDYFTIEKSHNGFNFFELANIPGAGTSKKKLNYTYFDVNPLNGLNYYRIKQTDFDGQFEYFDAIVIKFVPEPLNVSISHKDSKKIDINVISDKERTIQIFVIDLTGKVVLFRDLKIVAGLNIVTLDVFKSNRGILIINIRSDNKQVFQKTIRGRK